MSCCVVLFRRVANEKLEQLKQVQKEVQEAEEEANKLEKEKEVKVGHIVASYIVFTVHGGSCF